MKIRENTDEDKDYKTTVMKRSHKKMAFYSLRTLKLYHAIDLQKLQQSNKFVKIIIFDDFESEITIFDRSVDYINSLETLLSTILSDMFSSWTIFGQKQQY